ncbi:hypothetical protein RHSIM_Rhsim02G0220500 [Rhododendron simsii]|uniref:Ubiquitin-like protease family profile domain-containing protein n=1 Tax=Rhododendron simsii TaxID=118357 RepID=A0A834HIT8_RHOSS|nr:hypothetical protein RHSIM_Rhsim02G0220500 [Rhododendron simsii]
MTTEWGCYVSEKEYQEIEQKLKEAELKRVPLTASPPGSKRLPPCKVPPIRLPLPTTQPIQEVPKRKRLARKSTENQTQPPPKTHGREKRKREVQTQPPSPSLEEQQPKRIRKSPRQIPSKTSSHSSLPLEEQQPKRIRKSPRQIPSKTSSYSSLPLTYPIRTRSTTAQPTQTLLTLTYPQQGRRASTRKRARTTQTHTQTDTKNRSNLQLTVMFLQDLSLRADHLNLLKQTPFWLIIDSIISRTLDADKCIKLDTVFKKLVAAYNPETDCFTIAGKNVKLTANHVKLIFGISCGTEPFAAKLKTREQVAFAKRRNIQQRLTTKAISDMLKELAQENKTSIEDVQDVARLVCMFLIVKLFFPTSGITVSWKHVDAMEDLTKMKSYNWAAEIHNELVESIKKSQHSPKDVKGCQLLLPYWLCEHTNILEQELSEHQVPRLLKWNISTLEHALQAIPNIVKARKIKDSGSTLVPNTYLPTNAEVFPHLMLSPLPAYIHPDQDEPQPNLEFLCSSAVQRVTEPLVEQLQEVNRQQNVIIDTLKEQNKTNEVKMAELLQKIDFLYKERRNQQGKDKEALLLAIQNIKESHMAISEEKLQMEFEFIEAAAKQEQQLTDARMALIEEKKISLELKETAGKLAQELENARMEKMQMELEFIEAAAKQEQQLTDAQMALIEDKKISLAEKKAAEKKEHQLQTEKTQLEEEKMVFLEEVEALQQHKQEIERNNAELERENKELKKELLETKQRSKGSPKLEPFSNETEEQNIEQQVHSVTQSAQVKPYSTQDTLEFVHTITQATKKKPTPPSKYRRIKEKTSQGTRKLNVDPMYIYPLLDNRAAEEMKMLTNGPTDRKQLKKLNNQMQVLKLLPQPTFNVAYTGAKGFVMVEDIQEILRDGELGTETINAYAELLVEEYDNFPNFSLIESQPKRSYVFSGDLMRLAITKYICSEIRISRLENFSSTARMCPTPKQQPNSLDCGPIVCYIIQHYINNDVDGIAQSLTKHHVKKIRADIIHKILSQKSRSWTLEMHKSEEEARRLHSKLNCRDNKVKLNEP